MKLIAKATWALVGLFLLFTFGCAPTGLVNLPASEVGRADFRLTGDIEEQSSGLLATLERLGGRPILIEIDSSGGVADEGILIHKILRTAKSSSVCLVNGRAASAAFLILQGCTRRSMTRASYLFTHEPAIHFSGEGVMSLGIISAAMSSLQKTSDTMAEILSSRMDMSVSEYKKRVVGEGWRMGADEAIEANAIDVVVDSGRSPL